MQLYHCSICITDKPYNKNKAWVCGSCNNTQCLDCVLPLLKSSDSVLKIRCPMCRSNRIFLNLINGNRVYPKNVKILHAMLDAIYREIDEDNESIEITLEDHS